MAALLNRYPSGVKKALQSTITGKVSFKQKKRDFEAVIPYFEQLGMHSIVEKLKTELETDENKV